MWNELRTSEDFGGLKDGHASSCRQQPAETSAIAATRFVSELRDSSIFPI